MRRALLLFLALPAAALAQTAGTISTDDTSNSINIAQCQGTPNTSLELDDKMEIQLTWNASVPSGTTFPSGTYKLYVTQTLPEAGQGDGVRCTLDKNGATIATTPVKDNQDDDTFSADAQTLTRTFSFQRIAAAAGAACTTSSSDTGNKTLYLCVQWINAGGTAAGFANATLTLNRTAPAAPTNVSLSAGDGSLYVSCNGNSDTDTFKAIATAGTDTRLSNQASSCSDLRFTGLSNGTEYSVVVYGMNSANNPSDASSPPELGTPVKTDDFYDNYKDAGGREKGGCSSAGAAGLLSALAALLAFARRRKP